MSSSSSSSESPSNKDINLLSIAIGVNASVNGIACVSIGDGARAEGCFKVVVSDRLSIDLSLKERNSKFDKVIETIDNYITNYKLLEGLPDVPPNFVEEAVAALNNVKENLTSPLTANATKTQTPSVASSVPEPKIVELN